jgi:hypothetical protein
MGGGYNRGMKRVRSECLKPAVCYLVPSDCALCLASFQPVFASRLASSSFFSAFLAATLASCVIWYAAWPALCAALSDSRLNWLPAWLASESGAHELKLSPAKTVKTIKPNFILSPTRFDAAGEAAVSKRRFRIRVYQRPINALAAPHSCGCAPFFIIAFAVHGGITPFSRA